MTTKVFNQIKSYESNIFALKLVKQLEKEKRSPSHEESLILDGYIGWGGITNAFPNSNNEFVSSAWEARNKALVDLLTDAEYKEIKASLLDSFYTPTKIIDAMWQVAENLDCKSGIVLEPSCGSGRFIKHANKNNHFKFVGVELESIAAKVAKHSNSIDSYIFNHGFEKLSIPAGCIDLAIGNPPYGDFSLNFKNNPLIKFESVHNQFILESLRSLQDNGLAIFVVSRYVMDSKTSTARREMSNLAELLGSFRLPSSTFQNDANTEVVSDILVFRRRTSYGETLYQIKCSEQGADSWVAGLSSLESPSDNPVYFNSVFKNPNNCGGDLTVKTSAFGYTLDVVESAFSDTRLKAWVASMRYHPRVSSARSTKLINGLYDDLIAHININLSGKMIGVIDINSDGELFRIIEQQVNDGSFLYKTQVLTPDTVWSERYTLDVSGEYFELVPELNLLGEKVYQLAENGETKKRLVYTKKFTPVEGISNRSKLGGLRFNKLQLLISLRDTLLKQISFETNSDDQMESNRNLLNKYYEDFVKAHGFLNAPSNQSLIDSLPDGGLLLSLEFDYVKPIKQIVGLTALGKNSFKTIKKESAQKAAIFSKRVVYSSKIPDEASSSEHALLISIAYKGKVDLVFMGHLCSKTEDQLIDELYTNVDEPKIYKDYATGEWSHATHYLGGHVGLKLRNAKLFGDKKAINALSSIYPEPIAVENITMALGMNWITDSCYTEFLKFISDDSNAVVRLETTTNTYNVLCNTSPAKAVIYESNRITLKRLFECILNNQSIKITKLIEYEKVVVDHEATEQANLSAESIKSEFFDWLYTQPEILSELQDIYNNKFNSFVAPKYDGSHLVFNGKVPDEIVKLRKHQSNAVYRGILERFNLFSHDVGSGKTFTAISIAMERSRLGLSTKPLIIVPNHLVGQFSADVYRLYPTANILCATKKDFEKKRRKQLFSRIATGDFDLVVMAHSSFEFIKLSEEKQIKYLDEELSLLKDALLAEEQHCVTGKTRSAKKLAYKVKLIEEKINRMLNSSRNDGLLTFEQLGITAIFCDEAHLYKNLFYTTNLTDVVGMGNPVGSNKALDLHLKVKYLHEIGGVVNFFTGTPISNSAIEMHVMKRFLIPDILSDLDLENFDNWANIFAENTSKFEATESGKLKQVTRFARNWNNMRVLMNIWQQFTDTVTNEDLQRVHLEENGCDFPIPRQKGGGRQTVVIQPTEQQDFVLQQVLDGFKDLENITDYKECNAERLRLMDRARKLALSARCVDPVLYSNESGGKLEAVVKNVYQAYIDWNHLKGTQLIFLDRSVPKSSSDAKILKEYDEAASKLEEATMAENLGLISYWSDRLDKFNPLEIQELRSANNSTWTAYDEIKKQLIAIGVPSSEVRFIQEAKNDDQKQELFDMVKSGEVRVLIGSTSRMGAGTNVQQRLTNLHHVDIGWKPSDIWQREGRIIRQGNLIYELLGHDNFEIGITCYVTERTMDAKLWEINSEKLKMLNAIRCYKGEHSVDFGQDADSISMQEIAALATGNPLMLERVKLHAEIEQLVKQNKAFTRKQSGLRIQYNDSLGTIASMESIKSDFLEVKQIYEQSYLESKELAESLSLNLNGKPYSSKDEAEKALIEISKAKQPIILNDEKYTKTKALVFLNEFFDSKITFNLIGECGRKFNSTLTFAVFLEQFLIKKNNSDFLYEGTLFGLPLKVEAFEGISGNGYELAVFNLDQTKKIAYTESYKKTEKAKSIRAKIHLLLSHLEVFITRNLDNLNLANDFHQKMIIQLADLIDKPFNKASELAYKNFRLSLVEDALEEDEPDERISQLEEIHKEELDKLLGALNEKGQNTLTAHDQEVCNSKIDNSQSGSIQDDHVMDKIQETVNATQLACESIKSANTKKTFCNVVVNGEFVKAEQLDLF